MLRLLPQGTGSQGPLQLERCVGVSLLVLLGRSRPVGSGLGFRSAPKGLSRPEPIPISFSRAQNNVRNNSQSRELPDQVAPPARGAGSSSGLVGVRDLNPARPPSTPQREPCGCQAITLLPA